MFPLSELILNTKAAYLREKIMAAYLNVVEREQAKDKTGLKELNSSFNATHP